MVNVIWFVALLLGYCLVFARLEAEIEGENGWAKELPTSKYIWNSEEGKMYYKAFGVDTYKLVDHTTWPGKFYFFYINTILGGKDFTVYHRVIDVMQLFIAHLLVYLCFYQTVPIWLLEARAIATLMLIWSLEDTLYFFVNPAFGAEKYDPEHIEWHKNWLTISSVRIMDKGMFANFAGGLAIMILTFFLLNIWHWLVQLVK